MPDLDFPAFDLVTHQSLHDIQCQGHNNGADAITGQNANGDFVQLFKVDRFLGLLHVVNTLVILTNKIPKCLLGLYDVFFSGHFIFPPFPQAVS